MQAKHQVSIGDLSFLVADTQLHKRLCPSVRQSVHWSVRRSVMIELKSGKTDISAPAHPSATGGRVSSLVWMRNGGIDLICKGSMSNVNSLGKGKADACFVVESSFMLEGNSGVPICTFDRKSKQNIKLRFIDLLNSVTY